MNIQQSICHHCIQRYFIKWKYSINYCSASKGYSFEKKVASFIFLDEVEIKSSVLKFNVGNTEIQEDMHFSDITQCM